MRLAVESSFVRRGDCLIFQMRNPELTSQAESVIPKSQGYFDESELKFDSFKKELGNSFIILT